MRVTVVETDARGGLIHFAYQLAEGLAGEGADTTLLTGQDYELARLPHRGTVAPILRLWSPVEDLPASRTGWALRRAAWPFRRGWRAVVLAREWGQLTRHLTSTRPDLVIFSTIRFPFLALYLRHLHRRGVPMVQICHEFDDREAGGTPGPIRAAIRRLFPDPYAYFATIFLLSADAHRSFRAAHPSAAGRTALLPHGPERLFASDAETAAAVRARYRIDGAEPIVLMFGGLRPSKGVPDLLDAFARLGTVGRGPVPRLIIAGYPSRDFDRDGLVGRLRALGLQARVTLDFRYLSMAELGALIDCASVVVFPYRSATSSGAVALAQSLGRPVVATRVGGLSGAIDDGVTGWLVAPGDADALAAAMAQVLADPVAAKAVAERARAVILTERSWDTIARRLLAGSPGRDTDTPAA